MDFLGKENVTHPGGLTQRRPLQALKATNIPADSLEVQGFTKKEVRRPFGNKNLQDNTKKPTGPLNKPFGKPKNDFEIFCDEGESVKVNLATNSKFGAVLQPSKPTFAAYKDKDKNNVGEQSFAVYRDLLEDEDGLMSSEAYSADIRQTAERLRNTITDLNSIACEEYVEVKTTVQDNYSCDRDIEELEVNASVVVDNEKENLAEKGYDEDDNIIPETPDQVPNTPVVSDIALTATVDPYRHDDNYLAEYSEDMHLYLRQMELRIRPKANYMSKQPDITHSMRSILVDWLVEVSQEYKLETETLYLTISYIDRFLSSMSVLRSKLQLVGTASMFIASKYEEIYPPDLPEFVYITDDTYTKQQVLRMEQLILKAVSFDLSAPTVYYFIERLVYLCEVSDQVKNLSKYLCELTLLEGEWFLKFLPSIIATSALAIANFTFGLEPWTKEMREASGYNVAQLEECVIAMHKMFLIAGEYKHQAVREKYKSSKYNSVSLMTPPPLIYGRHQ